jgi:hypothetical protein
MSSIMSGKSAKRTNKTHRDEALSELPPQSDPERMGYRKGEAHALGWLWYRHCQAVNQLLQGEKCPIPGSRSTSLVTCPEGKMCQFE